MVTAKKYRERNREKMKRKGKKRERKKIRDIDKVKEGLKET